MKGDENMSVGNGITATKEWDDSKTVPHWRLTLGNHSVTCGELSGSDFQECVDELLTLAKS